MKTRRVTANLPVELVDGACKATGRGITETLVRGLELVKRGGAAAKLSALRAQKIHLDLDVGELRGRRR